jgi:hypothetical protein
MTFDGFWTKVRLLGLVGAVTFAAVAPPSVLPFSTAAVALADDDDEDDDEDEDAEAQGRVLNGQVLGIFEPARGWSKAPGTTFDETTPPGMTALRIGQTGNQIVPAILYNPNDIAEWGVKLGDHVSLDGEFVGGTFYANNLEVSERCC